MSPAYSRSLLPSDPDQIRIDIIIDNFDYGRFLPYAIESTLAQMHPHVNVIAVDDGSNDDSRDVLRRYEHDIDVVLKKNGGQASALNAGLARSSGDVVIFLDADDMLRQGTAHMVATAFAARPAAVMVQYRMEVVHESGLAAGALKPPGHLPLPSGDLRRAQLTFPFDVVTLPTSGNAFRADALRRIFPIPEIEFPLCADFYLVHLMPLLGSVVSLDEVGASYRVHGRNGYEPHHMSLDLGHVRQTIEYAAATSTALHGMSDELGLPRPYAEILSVSDLSNRLLSRRLEPSLHPLANDVVWRLLYDGTRAASRRFDVSTWMKLLYIGWFCVVALTPRRLVAQLAPIALYPQRRRRLNRLLGRLHSPPPATFR